MASRIDMFKEEYFPTHIFARKLADEELSELRQGPRGVLVVEESLKRLNKRAPDIFKLVVDDLEEDGVKIKVNANSIVVELPTASSIQRERG